MERLRTRFALAMLSAGFVLGSLGTLAVGAAMKGSAVFSDVPSGAYFDAAVGELYGLGIIKGFPDGTFHPGDPVSRADVAVMMKRLRDEVNGVTPDAGGTEGSSSSSRSRRTTSSSSSSSSSASFASVTPAGALRFTIDKVNLSEQSPTAKLSVVRTGGAKGEVSVMFKTKAGTATAGEDYVEYESTLTFKDGESSKLMSITLKDDATAEGSETFTIELHTPTGGAVLSTPAVLTVTLLDNESPSASTGGSTSSVAGAGTIGFSAAGYSVAENGGSITITLTREGGSTGTVGVNYATGNGSAVAGTEYASVSGVLSFAAGETSKTFTVTVNDNTSIDGNRTVNLTLSAPTGGTGIRTPNPVTLTIVDTDNASWGSGSIKLSAATYIADENDGQVTITAQRVGGSAGQASVHYETINGVAGSNDYTTVNGTLTFAPGETSKTFRIAITDDTLAEGEEDFSVVLGNPVGAELITPNSAVVKIQG